MRTLGGGGDAAATPRVRDETLRRLLVPGFILAALLLSMPGAASGQSGSSDPDDGLVIHLGLGTSQLPTEVAQARASCVSRGVRRLSAGVATRFEEWSLGLVASDMSASDDCPSEGAQEPAGARLYPANVSSGWMVGAEIERSLPGPLFVTVGTGQAFGEASALYFSSGVGAEWRGRVSPGLALQGLAFRAPEESLGDSGPSIPTTFGGSAWGVGYSVDLRVRFRPRR
jgi:hypothetical protein